MPGGNKTAIELTADAQALLSIQQTARAVASPGFSRQLQAWNEKIAAERQREAQQLGQHTAERRRLARTLFGALASSSETDGPATPAAAAAAAAAARRSAVEPRASDQAASQERHDLYGLRRLNRVSSSLASPFRANLERLLESPTTARGATRGPCRRRQHAAESQGAAPNHSAALLPSHDRRRTARGRNHGPSQTSTATADVAHSDGDDEPLPPFLDPHEHMDEEMVRLARLNLVGRILDGEARERLERIVSDHVERRLGGAEGMPIADVVRVHRRRQQPRTATARRPPLDGPNIQDLVDQIDELRRALKTSMALQLDIQRSIKMEVACAINGHEVQQRHCSRPQQADNCVVCLEARAECVVVRCGHWCLCQSCGLEIKSKRMPCPICRAPVTDVMTVYR